MEAANRDICIFSFFVSCANGWNYSAGQRIVYLKDDPREPIVYGEMPGLGAASRVNLAEILLELAMSQEVIGDISETFVKMDTYGELIGKTIARQIRRKMPEENLMEQTVDGLKVVFRSLEAPFTKMQTPNNLRYKFINNPFGVAALSTGISWETEPARRALNAIVESIIYHINPELSVQLDECPDEGIEFFISGTKPRTKSIEEGRIPAHISNQPINGIRTDIPIKPVEETLLSREKSIQVIENTMKRFNYESHGLVEVLMTAQNEFGFISKDTMTFIAKKLNIPVGQVYSVVTFYDLLTVESQGVIESQICVGSACSIAGASDVLNETLHQTGISKPGQSSPDGKYKVKVCNCLGLCDQAPAGLVNNKAQVNLSPDMVTKMLRAEAQTSKIQIKGRPRAITADIGHLSPTDLDAHWEKGAFKALETALHEMTPEQVIAEVKESYLTGRGGAGFSTGLKWELTREAQGNPKYMVCNFDESEPGTFKDRVLMEGNPFRVIEGMMIGAYATGATKGFIFARGEYHKASEILDQALDSMYSEHLLGERILGTEYTFDIEIRHNAGAYICGEETALFEAIEGKRGYPRHKPPYPTRSGLFGKPTAINNVETLAVVPSLIQHGGEWFRQWGIGKSVGLKLFCLSGHVKEPGVIEVPYGLTIRELVEEFGGGFDGEPQAVLVGGAAGGFLNHDHLDVPLTHEDLAQYEVPIGSGALVVFNQSVDLWKVLEGLAHFFVHESCGQCAPCRIGTNKIFNFLQLINRGNGKSMDLSYVEKLGLTIKDSCVCGLGMTAANPFLTYLHNFERALDTLERR